MTNVIDFTQFLESKKRTQEEVAFGEKLLDKNTETINNFLSSAVPILKEECPKPLLPLFAEVFQDVFTSAATRDCVGNRLGLLYPDTTMYDGSTGTYQEIFHFTNAFTTEACPTCRLSVLGLFTKESLFSSKHIKVNDIWRQTGVTPNPTQADTDVQSVRQIILDYVYSHPDSDTQRDRGSGALSIISYEVVRALLERGFACTDYSYTVDYIDGKKRPQYLLMDFVRGEEHVYYYYDHEAALKLCELYLKQVFDIDPE